MKRAFCFVLALTCWLGFSVISGSAAPTAEGASVSAESQTNPGMRNRRRQRRQWRRHQQRQRRHYRRHHNRNRNDRNQNRPNR